MFFPMSINKIILLTFGKHYSQLQVRVSAIVMRALRLADVSELHFHLALSAGAAQCANTRKCITGSSGKYIYISKTMEQQKPGIQDPHLRVCLLVKTHQEAGNQQDW